MGSGQELSAVGQGRTSFRWEAPVSPVRNLQPRLPGRTLLTLAKSLGGHV